MTADRILSLCDLIDQQAKCLEGYAESHGFEAKPVPSVFHFQAGHFRDLARDIRREVNGE